MGEFYRVPEIGCLKYFRHPLKQRYEISPGKGKMGHLSPPDAEGAERARGVRGEQLRDPGPGWVGCDIKVDFDVHFAGKWLQPLGRFWARQWPAHLSHIPNFVRLSEGAKLDIFGIFNGDLIKTFACPRDTPRIAGRSSGQILGKIDTNTNLNVTLHPGAPQRRLPLLAQAQGARERIEVH